MNGHHSGIEGHLGFTNFSEMDSKAVVLVFCVLLAASFMSETEAVYSQNPDNNGKRSLVSLLYCIFSIIL